MTEELTLTLQLESKPSDLKLNIWETFSEWDIHNNTTATIIKYDENNNYSSSLATRWEVKDKKRKYIFYFDKPMYWSNGDLITLADIAQSVFLNPKHHLGKILKGMIKKVDGRLSVKVDDKKRSIEVVLSHPTESFLPNLTYAECGLIDWSNAKVNDFKLDKTYKNIRYSGSYFVNKITTNKVFLQRNTYSKKHWNKFAPQKVVFIYFDSRLKFLNSIKNNLIDFHEIRGDDVVNVADRTNYRIRNAAYDTLTILQSRQLSDDQAIALQRLSSLIDRKVLTRRHNGIPSRYVLLDSITENDFLDDSIKPYYSKEKIFIKVQYGSDLPKQQREDLKYLKEVAEKSNIILKLELKKDGFHNLWENENYESTITNIGVFTHDEPELWKGYLCTGFTPYKKLEKLACKEIRKASELGVGNAEKVELLRKAYRKLLNSGYFIPLYFSPRRYLVNRKWRLTKFNPLSPYPSYSNFQLKK